MESSIAPHLRCPRNNPSNLADGHTPTYPSWSARLDEGVRQVVFANFGVQWNTPDNEVNAREYVREIVGQLGNSSGVDHFDVAQYQDEAGCETLVVLAYWLNPETFEQWRKALDLSALGSEVSHLGRFEEVLTPDVGRIETLYSAPEAVAGIGKATNALSDEVVEHAYWGSARDRLPISQTDVLSPSGTNEIIAPEGAAGKIIVKGHENVAIIRSGQNWSLTSGEERDLYLGDIEPHLRAGMDFLRDHGRSIGCYCNRFMSLVDLDGKPEEKTFGWSYWHSLAEMEQWAEAHPTHLAIFDTFNEVVVKLNFDLDLRLSHEIYVVRANEQSYSYYNCHPQTGLLKLAT